MLAPLADKLPCIATVFGANQLDHFAIQIEEFDAELLLGNLARAGVEASPVAQRYGAEGMGPSIYLRDPDGNTVELKGPGEKP